MILHVTRHGQVDLATDHPVGDSSLSTLGREQAGRLGEKLKEEGFSGSIFSSPYLRTVETAQIIADVVGGRVIPAPAMREYVIREDQVDAFRGATAKQLKELYSRVEDWAAMDYPWWTSEVESPEDIEARVAPLVDETSAGETDALLVGHGASIAGVHRYILNARAPEISDQGKHGWNCVLSSFKFGSTFEVVRFLETDHLPEKLVTSNAKSRAEVLKEEAGGGEYLKWRRR